MSRRQVTNINIIINLKIILADLLSRFPIPDRQFHGISNSNLKIFRLKVEKLMKITSSEITLDEWAYLTHGPMQTACGTLKRFGGTYSTYFKVYDGHKFVCMDDLQLGEVLICC